MRYNNVHCDCTDTMLEKMMNNDCIQIKEIINPKLLTLYAKYKTEIMNIPKASITQLDKVTPLLNHDTPGNINEMCLFHGTSEDVAETIAYSGFNDNYSRIAGLYGKGIYFASNACKSYQYTALKGNDKPCFIISKVVMGNPLIMKQFQLFRDKTSKNLPVVNHSIFSKSFPDDAQMPANKSHNEYIVHSPDQIYPLYIVVFKKIVLGGKMSPKNKTAIFAQNTPLPDKSDASQLDSSNEKNDQFIKQLDSSIEKNDKFIQTHNNNNKKFIEEMIRRINEYIIDETNNVG